MSLFFVLIFISCCSKLPFIMAWYSFIIFFSDINLLKFDRKFLFFANIMHPDVFLSNLWHSSIYSYSLFFIESIIFSSDLVPLCTAIPNCLFRAIKFSVSIIIFFVKLVLNFFVFFILILLFTFIMSFFLILYFASVCFLFIKIFFFLLIYECFYLLYFQSYF